MKNVNKAAATYAVQWINSDTNEVCLSDGKVQLVVDVNEVKFVDFNKLFARIILHPTFVCDICKKSATGYSNNAAPFAAGVCCDECNMSVVMPFRFNLTSK